MPILVEAYDYGQVSISSSLKLLKFQRNRGCMQPCNSLSNKRSMSQRNWNKGRIRAAFAQNWVKSLVCGFVNLRPQIYEILNPPQNAEVRIFFSSSRPKRMHISTSWLLRFFIQKREREKERKKSATSDWVQRSRSIPVIHCRWIKIIFILSWNCWTLSQSEPSDRKESIHLNWIRRCWYCLRRKIE